MGRREYDEASGSGGVYRCFFFQAEDGIRDSVASRGLGDVCKGQVVTTAAPNMFSSYGQPKGMHGYRPETPDMWGIVYALGAAIDPKKIGPVHQVDVAPTIANILGIEMPDDTEGRVIKLGE